jgi:hypothetical protein
MGEARARGVKSNGSVELQTSLVLGPIGPDQLVISPNPQSHAESEKKR